MIFQNGKRLSGLDLQQYFIDAFAQSPGLTEEQRAQVSADLFGVLRTVTKIVTGTAGSTLTRSQETSVDLPRALSDGYVQKVIWHHRYIHSGSNSTG